MESENLLPETSEEALRNNPYLEGTHHLIELAAKKEKFEHYHRAFIGLTATNPLVFSAEDAQVIMDGYHECLKDYFFYFDELVKSGKLKLK